MRKHKNMHTFIRKKKALFFMTAFFTCIVAAKPAFAETAIHKVSIRFEEDGFDNLGFPEISASSNGTTYSVSDPVLVSGTSDPGSDDKEEWDNMYTVELAAEDGYYFSVSGTDDISVKGLDAVLLGAKRQDNGETLILAVQLAGIQSLVGEIPEAKWGADGRGIWEEAFQATLYQARLTHPDGTFTNIRTCGTSYDFSSLMQEEGDYSYRVRPINGERHGEWADGGSISVTGEMAESNRTRYPFAKEITYTGTERRPDTMVISYPDAGWQEEENGQYRYREQSGAYLQSAWLLEGEHWYYFDENGYMVTGTVKIRGIEYDFDKDGKLVE